MAWLDFLLRPSAGKVQLTSAYVGQPTDSPPRWARPGIARTAFDFLPHYDPERVELLARCLSRPDERNLRGQRAVCVVEGGRGPRYRMIQFRGRRTSVQLFEGDPGRYRRWLGVRLKAQREREIAAFGLADEAVA